MNILDNLKQKAKGSGLRIIFPEGSDERIKQASKILEDENICKPMLITREIVRNKPDEIIERYAEEYSYISGINMETSRKIVLDPLIFSALATRLNDADGMVGGCVYTSGDFIAASKQIIGLKQGISVPSSFFIMEIPNFNNETGGYLIYADASVNPDPCANALADIAVTTAKTAKNLLGWTPRVALLSFSTKGSAMHPLVDKVVKAIEIARKKSEFFIDGEFQADAALVESTAKRKIPGDIGKVAGRANVLIFPDLNAANISYKLTQILAHANAYGPILQGFKKPLSDLSRGAKVKDIVGITAIVCAGALR